MQNLMKQKCGFQKNVYQISGTHEEKTQPWKHFQMNE